LDAKDGTHLWAERYDRELSFIYRRTEIPYQRFLRC
jgi:TolB-like protein